jgi:sortase A
MPLYRYVKAIPKKPVKRSVYVSYGLIGTGVLILLWTLWPILSFSTFTGSLAKTVSPVGVNGVFSGRTLTPIAQAADIQNPNTWFPTSPQKKVTAKVNTYTLSIPKLKITNALVTISGDDLGVSLVHYGGTPLPGQYGNAVIFGHSTLPQFFNATNYKTIFSFLPTIIIGDEIDVTYDGVKYKYVVYDMVVVEPTDLSPLEQRFDDSYMTIITCVPPGTYWKRLNVKAKIVKTS